MRRDSWKVIAGVVALVALTLLALGGTADAATPALAWSDPSLADVVTPFATGQALSRVQCPTTSLCVAIDQRGSVETSTQPTGGSPRDWRRALIDTDAYGGGSSGVAMTGLSCPATGLCVAVDTDGALFVSTNPTGGHTAWQEDFASPAVPFQDVSCASTSLCVAVDSTGRAAISTDPTDPTPTWSVSNYDLGGTDLNASVSCPATGLCVVVANGRTFTTKNATAGASATWASETADGSALTSSISCASTTLCAFTDTTGNVVTSTDPLDAGTATWKAKSVAGGVLMGITCTSTPLCLAVDVSGALYSTVDPADADTATWVTTDLSGVGVAIAVACATSPSLLCAGAGGDATGSAGAVMTATNPTGGSGSWKATDVDGWNPLTGIACPSASLCVGVDFAGSVLTTSAPTSDGTSWTGSNVDGGGNATRTISCASSSLCAFTGSAGQVFTSTAPASGPASWTGSNVDGSNYLTGISCTAAGGTLCVAVDQSGNAVTSTTPTDSSSWTAEPIDAAAFQGLSGVSCPSTGLCVAVDPNGNVFTTTDPIDGAAAVWSMTSVPIGLTGISCPSTGLCIASSGSGDVARSTDPLDGASATWSDDAAGGGWLYGVSCSPGSPTVCVAGSNDAVLMSADPAAGASSWTGAPVNTIDPLAIETIGAVACVSTTLCVAGDNFGDVLAGTPPPPGSGDVAPAVTTNPVSIGVDAGQPAQFSAAASDTPAPTVKWQVSLGGGPWIDIAGATQTTYLIPSTTADENGNQYRAVFTNAAGSVPTQAATLTVTPVSTGGGTSTTPTTATTTTTTSTPPPTSSTSSGGGAGSASTVDPAQVAGALSAGLAPTGKADAIGAIVKTGVLQLTGSALESGTETISAYQLPRGAHLPAVAKAKAVLVASGRHVFGAPGKVTVKLKLTAAGRRALRHALRMRLVVRAIFTAPGRPAVVVTRTVTLKR